MLHPSLSLHEYKGTAGPPLMGLEFIRLYVTNLYQAFISNCMRTELSEKKFYFRKKQQVKGKRSPHLAFFAIVGTDETTCLNHCTYKNSRKSIFSLLHSSLGSTIKVQGELKAWRSERDLMISTLLSLSKPNLTIYWAQIRKHLYFTEVHFYSPHFC